MCATEGRLEASDCRLAGYKSASVICEIINDDGTMAKPLEVYWSTKSGYPDDDREGLSELSFKNMIIPEIAVNSLS